jgi:hypothetical protein
VHIEKIEVGMLMPKMTVRKLLRVVRFTSTILACRKQELKKIEFGLKKRKIQLHYNLARIVIFI